MTEITMTSVQNNGHFLKRHIFPLCAVAVCLLTRLLFFGRYIDEWDSVNFAFGLSKGYDILHDQPHFPGYPVYMFFSWIWYKIIGSDIKALIFSGVLFSSIAVFPLYELAKRLFSENVAILAVILYIVNPQIWLQAEKPLSDAFGIFFVVTSVLFFYLAIESADVSEYRKRNENRTLKYLAVGGVLLGLGLGVRVTYLALVPLMIYVAFQLRKKISLHKIAVWGISGIAVGISSWFVYLIVRFTPDKFFKKFMSHADYHFYKDGNSIVTTNNYFDRAYDIAYRFIAHCMGMWWHDAFFLRIVPTIFIIFSVVYFVKKARWSQKIMFLSVFFIFYILWIVFIQNAIRQIMALIPFMAIVVSAGLFYFYTHYLKNKKYGNICFYFLTGIFILSQAADSVRIVSINRNETPPSVAQINYITEHFQKEDSKFYCLNDWRLFQYYAPEWCDKKNSHVYFVSHMNGVRNDLQRLKNKPENILVSSKLFGRHKYKERLRELAVFKRDNYSVADYNWVALYRFERKNTQNKQEGKRSILKKQDFIDDQGGIPLVKFDEMK
ncbi:MAG: glycosyltransferase family 39 protein [Planctomycetes bacterium]|nr:glycosyltransferase family 39 protein [Planctomycetota bacterium]